LRQWPSLMPRRTPASERWTGAHLQACARLRGSSAPAVLHGADGADWADRPAQIRGHVLVYLLQMAGKWPPLAWHEVVAGISHE